MDGIRQIRSALREQGAERPAREIPQQVSIETRRAWCASHRLHPEELCAIARLRRNLANAEMLSAVCQRWLLAHMAGADVALAKASFPVMVAAHNGDRSSALTDLANTVLDALAAEVGEKQTDSYLAALMVTGELDAAPRDVAEN